MHRISLIALGALLTLPLTGCGGGGGGGTPPPQQRSATITFSLNSTASLQGIPVNGIRLTAQLPPGLTIPIKSGTATEIDPSALTGLKPGLLAGNYSTAVRRMHIYMADTANVGLGSFARLICQVNNGVTLSEKEFTDINKPFPDFAASGFDPDPNAIVNPVDLTGKTAPALAVTFDY